jgi:hypothetical protein
MEERNPHAEKSTARRDPEILAARESPERFLRRRRRRFGERRSGGKKKPRGIFTPAPSSYRLTVGGRNSGPGGGNSGPRNFRDKLWNF